jgi:hypothetical protein
MQGMPETIAVPTVTSTAPAVARAAVVTLPTSLTNLTINGTFLLDTAWNKGTGWTIAAGKATKAAGTASLLAETTGTLTDSEYYLVRYDIVAGSYTAGTVQAKCGTTAGTAYDYEGSFAEILQCVALTQLVFSASADADLSIDNIRHYHLGETVTPAGEWRVIDAVEYSYDDTPTGGAVEIWSSSGKLWGVDVAATGIRTIPFPVGGIYGTQNTPLVVALKAGGAAVTGKLTVTSR